MGVTLFSERHRERDGELWKGEDTRMAGAVHQRLWAPGMPEKAGAVIPRTPTPGRQAPWHREYRKARKVSAGNAGVGAVISRMSECQDSGF